MDMGDLNLASVNWRDVGEALAMALMAAGAAWAGARRVWKKGLGDMLRPVIQKEVGAAVRHSMRTLREEIVEQTQAAVREELGPLREELDELSHRLARVEGAVEVLSDRQASTKETTK